MKHQRLWIVMGWLLLASVVALAAGDEAVQVDQLFENWTRPGSPGAAVAVIRDGEIVFKNGYGLANLELNVPISPHSVFYMGSVSKQFVAFSIALLEQEGKLRVKDDVREYVPELPDYGDTITIEHLVHHTSGLRDYLGLMSLAGLELGHFHSDQEVIDLIARQKALNFKPGKRYLYSNSGYFLLAVIVNRVTGMSLKQYTKAKIFEPLGMNNSHFHDDYTHLIPNRASSYLPGISGYKSFLSTFDRVGSGGLFSTVEDVALWDANFYHHKVGGAQVVRRIHARGKLNDGEEIDYAYGISIGEYKGLKTVSHGGALGGYRSSLMQFPEERFSVVILANLSAMNTGNLASKIADIYLESRFPTGESQSMSSAKAKPTLVKLPVESLRGRTGGYEDPETGTIWRFSVFQGRLVANRGRSVIRLGAVTEKRFVSLNPGREVEVEFEEASSGRARVHWSSEGGSRLTLNPVELVTPEPEELAEYAGSYYSPELDATYRIVLEKGKLFPEVRRSRNVALRPTVKDRFEVLVNRIQFHRDESGRIRGYRLDAGRVKGIEFVKETGPDG